MHCVRFYRDLLKTSLVTFLFTSRLLLQRCYSRNHRCDIGGCSCSCGECRASAAPKTKLRKEQSEVICKTHPSSYLCCSDVNTADARKGGRCRGQGVAERRAVVCKLLLLFYFSIIYTHDTHLVMLRSGHSRTAPGAQGRATR